VIASILPAEDRDPYPERRIPHGNQQGITADAPIVVRDREGDTVFTRLGVRRGQLVRFSPVVHAAGVLFKNINSARVNAVIIVVDRTDYQKVLGKDDRAPKIVSRGDVV
jgi:hypothetical protein